MRSLDFLGRSSPAIGQGTWKIGDDRARHDEEVAALRRGLDHGLTVIDTAEMYGAGAAERLVGEAIAGRRAEVTLVSKVYPQNAGVAAMARACENSLRRLGVERLDLYLLHWRGAVPLAETVEGFERLQRAGKIAAWGVSNFDVADLEELTTAGGSACATNQVLYNLVRRGPEYDLLPYMAARGMPLMAYSPIEQGRLPDHPVLNDVAARHDTTPAAVALAFSVRSGAVLAIPKAGSRAHVEANRASADLTLSPDDLAALDRAFPPPRRKGALEML